MLARVKKLTEAMTKTQMYSDIAEKTELTRRQVADVFEALESVIERHVQKGAVDACTIPCSRPRGNDQFSARVDHEMLWWTGASSDRQRARVLAGVKARRYAPPPLPRGLRP